jgi:hypothetical protein
MRNIVTASAVFSMLAFAGLLQCQDTPSDTLFSPDQLDNLLAPVALYPDPLLAQILVAATFPDQITDGAQFVKAGSNPNDIDGQSWDVSVKAVAHYSTVIKMMADQIDWTTALGQAYVNQPDDVMAAVQRLRAEAQAAGNLQSDDQMQVLDDGGSIEIWPAQDQYIYVPDYDPSLVYARHAGFFFGPGFFIGAWLNLDFDWQADRIFYHGWERTKGWATRSRPYIRDTGVYVNLQFNNVVPSRAVVSHNVNYSNLNRYNSVHPGVSYRNFRPAAPVSNSAPATNNYTQPNVTNRETRTNDNRGRASVPQPRQFEPAPEPRPVPEMHRPEPAFRPEPAPRPAPEYRPAPAPRSEPAPRPVPEYRPAPAPRSEPAPRPAPEYHPAPPPRQEPAARPEPAHSAPAAHDDGGKKR